MYKYIMQTIDPLVSYKYKIYTPPQQCHDMKGNVNGMKRIEIVEDITILCHIEICKDILHSHAFRNT